jgi:hypothetical protein
MEETTMKMRERIVAIAAASDENALKEGESCTISGKLEILVVHIKPEDRHGTEQGPTAEYFALVTPKPRTFTGTDIETNKPVTIKSGKFQLAGYDENQVAALRALVGKRVELVAEPFLRNTMYHHTPVMLLVSSFHEAPK